MLDFISYLFKASYQVFASSDQKACSVTSSNRWFSIYTPVKVTGLSSFFTYAQAMAGQLQSWNNVLKLHVSSPDGRKGITYMSHRLESRSSECRTDCSSPVAAYLLYLHYKPDFTSFWDAKCLYLPTKSVLSSATCPDTAIRTKINLKAIKASSKGWYDKIYISMGETYNLRHAEVFFRKTVLAAKGYYICKLEITSA